MTNLTKTFFTRKYMLKVTLMLHYYGMIELIIGLRGI